MAIGTMAALGIASAGLGLAKGIGGAIAAKRSFTKEQEARLRELERLNAEGELGLEEEERARLEGELASARGAALRQAEVQGAQARQAAQVSGAGRDLFLAEFAGAEAAQQARAEGARLIAEQEAMARQQQRQELAALQQMQGAARAGVVSALTGGLAAGAEGAINLAAQDAMQQAQYEREAVLEQQRLFREALGAGLVEQSEYEAFLGG